MTLGGPVYLAFDELSIALESKTVQLSLGLAIANCGQMESDACGGHYTFRYVTWWREEAVTLTVVCSVSRDRELPEIRICLYGSGLIDFRSAPSHVSVYRS